MKRIRILGILLALGVFLGAFVPFSAADEWDKTTKVKSIANVYQGRIPPRIP